MIRAGFSRWSIRESLVNVPTMSAVMNINVLLDNNYVLGMYGFWKKVLFRPAELLSASRFIEHIRIPDKKLQSTMSYHYQHQSSLCYIMNPILEQLSILCGTSQTQSTPQQ